MESYRLILNDTALQLAARTTQKAGIVAAVLQTFETSGLPDISSGHSDADVAPFLLG